MKEYTNGWFDQQVEKLPQHIQDIWNKWTWPPESFDTLLKDAQERARIVAYLVGCNSLDTLLQNMLDITESLRNLYKNKIPQTTEELLVFRQMIMDVVDMFAKEYQEKRLCHDGFGYAVCFCDEIQ